jgi:3-deoxy-D-manno-octulosonic-acid transferase
MRSFYTALFYAASPLIVGRLLWKGIKAPAYRERIPERFGYYSLGFSPASVWLHAVSVGEAEAAFPLLRGLLQRYPALSIVVTTTTPTGSARVRSVLGNAVEHVYLPYDLPGPIRRFMTAFRPRLALIMETEIWPNLFKAAADSSVPLVIVNGRLSERSATGYQRIRSLTASSLSDVTFIAAQSDADADRFIALGADPARVEAVGNIKFDMELPASIGGECAKLRSELFGNRPVLIAGSTHDGEEQLILAAARSLWATIPNLLVILVPRHPERFADVADLCHKEGLTIARRGDGASAVDSQVYLLDTMGELRLFYGASDVAFVGGSLVPTGGHNLLEPAALGVPVVFGPHVFNFRDMARGMLEAEAAVQVKDASELAPVFQRLLTDPQAREEQAEKGKSFFSRGRGALNRIFQRLAEWVPAGPEQAA